MAGEAGEEARGYGCDVGRRLYATASRGGSGSVGSVVLPSLVRQAWSTSIARPLMIYDLRMTIYDLRTEHLCQIQNEDIQRRDAASAVRMTR